MKNLRFIHKIYLGIAFSLLIFMIGTIIINTLFFKNSIEKKYERELINITESLYHLSYNAYTINQNWVNSNLNVSNSYIEGKTSIDKNLKIPLEIEDQITHQKKIKNIPLMYVKNSLGFSEIATNNIELVDYITNQIGGTVTIFQLIEEGLLRVSTSVKHRDGSRAIGTYINTESPVYKTVMNGKTYRGRAYVVNDWYITAYKPIYDNGEIIGVIYVGVKQSELNALKKTISKLHLGSTYYPLIFDIEGNVIINLLNGKKNIYQQKDAKGKPFIKNIIDSVKVHKKLNGEILYEWEGKNKRYNKREMYYLYLPEMKWIVSTSMELKAIQKPLTEQIGLNIFISVILFIVILIIVLFSGKRFTKQLNILSDAVIKYTSKNFNVRAKVISNDELGELASSFNTMADQLDELYSDLTKKVEERTQELNNKTEELQQQNEEIEQQNEEIRAINDEIQQMNTDLAESEQKIRRMIEDLGDEYIFYTQQVDGKYTYISPSITKILGYTAEDVASGFQAFLTNHKKNIKAIELSKKSFNGEKQNAFEIEIYDNHKNIKHFEITEVPVFNKQNEVVLVEGIFHDISRRKKSERIQRVLNHITQAVVTTDTLKELVLFIQKELSRIIDTTNYFIALYDRDSDTLSLPFMADTHDNIESIPAGKTMTAYVIRNKKPLLATSKMQEQLVKKGEIEFVGTRSKVWLGVPLIVSGDAIGAIVLQSYTSEDAYNNSDKELLELIAGQISQHIQQKSAEQKEKEQQDLFDKITSSANDAIIVIDNDGNIIFWNDSAETIFGYSKEEVLKRKLKTITTSRFYREMMVKAFHIIKNEGNSEDAGKVYEIMAHRRDKTEFPIELSLSAVKLNDKWSVIGTIRDITERKIAEEKLQEEKDYAERILSVIPSAVFTVDKNEIITSWNQKAESLTGWKAHEIIGQSCKTFVLSPCTKTCNLYDNSSSTLFKSKECSIKTKNGKILTISKNIDYLKDTEGNIIGGIESFEDITERKKNELIKQIISNISDAVSSKQNLQELIEYIQVELSKLIDTTNYFIALYDEKTDTLSLPFFADKKDRASNIPAKGTLTGYVIKTKTPILATEKDMSKLEEKGEIKLVGTSSKAWLGVPLIIHNKVIGALAVQNYEDENAFSNEDFKFLKLISHQISLSIERKRNSDELKAKNFELSTQKEELETTLENLKEAQTQLIQSEKMAALGTLIAGIAHEINTPLGAINASVGNMADSLETVIQNIPNLLKTLMDEDMNLFIQVLKLVEDAAPELTSKEKRKLKREISSLLSESNIENPDKLAETVVYMRINKHLDSLLPMLRSPNAGLILSNARNIVSLKKNTENITIAVTKAAKVVFALKKFAHRDHVGEKVPADIIDGIETVLTLYYNQIKQGVEIIREIAPLPPVPCFADEINQVWTNLFHNSLQAMENKGKIKIKTWVEGNFAKISISDTGGGIPEDIREKIFEPFFTTKKAGEGSGLGLDIVKKIIDKHDGTIELESEVGIGTTFTISLPVEDRT